VLSCTRACVNACMHTAVLVIRRDACRRVYVKACFGASTLPFRRACVNPNLRAGVLSCKHACVDT
jgi:hypothetical protein